MSKKKKPNIPSKPTGRAARPGHPKGPGPNREDAQLLAALFGAGRYGEAANLAYGMTIRAPQDAIGWKGLGLAYQLLGRHQDALEPTQTAAELAPKDADIHNHLGALYRELGQAGQAVESCRKAVALRPGFSEAHNNLGRALQDLGKAEEALPCYEQALALKPDSWKAYSNLGTALSVLGRFEEAIACHRRTLALNPNFAQAHFNLGNALNKNGRADEAIASYRRALEFEPAFAADVHNNLGNVLSECGRSDDAATHYYAALALRPENTDSLSNILFLHQNRTDLSDAARLEDARHFGRVVAAEATGRFTSWTCTPHPERLRIGLVSGDFREHPVGHFIESVLAAIDPSRLELFGYPTISAADSLTKRIQPHFAAWKALDQLGNEAAARLIQSDGLHILLDLAGHTNANRLPLFAWKPAPVQATWLGYFATTGVAEIDYLLGDPYSTPAEEDSHFTERVWRLPETRMCFTPPHADLEVGPLPALANGYVTFGCFNRLGKMNGAVVALWARVLHAVPDSRLFLKSKEIGYVPAQETTRKQFAEHGISAERLVFDGLSPRAEYLAAYRRVDIALDPFPYTGGTTSAEGLWMGVPVVTKRGDRLLSHQGECIARNAGLPDWIAADEDDYVARAAAFAADLPRLAALRGGLRTQVLASPLFDARRFARHFEDALWKIWNRWLQGQPS
jgi:predicted O-linked N-acetylglucosamine transferase (SPINDLY family)